MNIKMGLLAVATLVSVFAMGCGNSCGDFDCSKCDALVKASCEVLVDTDDGDSCDAAHDVGTWDSCK